MKIVKHRKILRLILGISLIAMILLDTLKYAYGNGSYNTLGTNDALGSPVLNANFSADDWNKWEMVVWGIFLSNFATPFVDDYNSAFNLNSGYGSNGNGSKALNFGSGQDPANSKVLQDLLDYAINQQATGAVKRVYVGYNKLQDNEITEVAPFNVANTSSSAVAGGAGTGIVTSSTEIRLATVKDLIFESHKNDKKAQKGEYDGETWAPWESNSKDEFKLTVQGNNILVCTDYMDIIGMEVAGIPTFAIDTGNGTYETVFDYSDSYDLSLMPLVIARGLGGDFKSQFIEVLNDVFENPENYPIVLDCFGNICTSIEGTYRIIIPAAANKHLTKNPGINLINSLIFNACTKTSTDEQMLIHAGQAYGDWLQTFFGDSSQIGRGGVPAFSRETRAINPGQAVLYFDTDTIITQDAFENEDDKRLLYIHGYTVNMAEVLLKLYDLDINKYTTQTYPFKIEPANIDSLLTWASTAGLNKKPKKSIHAMTTIATQLVNQLSKEQKIPTLTTLKTDTGDISIFSEPIAIPVMVNEGADTGENTFYSEAGIRFFTNWVYQRYMTDLSMSSGDISSSEIKKILESVRDTYESRTVGPSETGTDVFGSNKSSTEQLIHKLTLKDNNQFSNLIKGFFTLRTDFYNISNKSELDTYDGGSKFGIKNFMKLFEGTEDNSGVKLSPKTKISEDNWFENLVKSVKTKYNKELKYAQHNPFGRTVKVYTTSNTMNSIANILGVREGTEFAVFSSYIYMTYLDWYGVTGLSMSKLSGDKEVNNLNERIFDSNADILKMDITQVTKVISDEQKEKQILNWTYTMLNPSEGRAYRSNIIISGISDWIYDNYMKIVYGGATSYYDTGTGVTSKNSTGFLTIAPYSDNFMTAWFVGNYSYFAIILIGIFFVLTIIMGILRKKKFSWYLISMVVVINTILIVPASGEIVPLISNQFVQGMFEDKMSYWAISESVTNATMESDYASGSTLSNRLGSLTLDEQQKVINMVKNLNVLNLDRSLCIKQDISKKINSTQSKTYEDLQSYRSARWLLPLIMRQFTASDNSKNYLYIPLGDLYDNLSNLYWYYKPTDAAYVSTVNAKQTRESLGAEIPSYKLGTTAGLEVAGNRKTYFNSYDGDITDDEKSYRHPSYTVNEKNNVHTYSYMLQQNGLIQGGYPNSYDDYDEYIQKYLKNIKTSSANLDTQMRTVLANIEKEASAYNRFDRSTMGTTFGYLWATENPFHYFYGGVKDSFVEDGSIGVLVGELQGSYEEVEDSDGNILELRKSFMHNEKNGFVRDILDLEDMFTNMIPYMYSMQIIADGYGDEAGVFDSSEYLENYDVYKTNKKSWIFRSNWVTKLYEREDLNKSATIGIGGGDKVVVDNMLMPWLYEAAGRKMVFSRGQMVEMGLHEKDLSLVELKCVKINDDASKQWTLLLNYASVPGMTKEVMFRQMALDALLAFNAEFTPVGILNGSKAMYPAGIDLRSISFDSVMKMLMLNITHDTSYIYGDTMQTIVEDSDIITALLLLTTAFICVYVIPLVRNFTLGLIFFLGFWAILWSLLKTNKDKAKVSCGYLFSNIVFMMITFVYYLAFKAIMAMTTSNEVLSLSQVEINTGNPVWCMIFVLLVSILYIYGMYKMIQFCIKNYRDMGFEIYAGIAEMAAGAISNSFEGAIGKLSGDSKKKSGKSEKSRGKKSEPVEVKETSEKDKSSNKDEKGKQEKTSTKNKEYDIDDSASNYNTSNESKDTGSNEIDKEIQKGREIAKEEKEAKESK